MKNTSFEWLLTYDHQRIKNLPLVFVCKILEEREREREREREKCFKKSAKHWTFHLNISLVLAYLHLIANCFHFTLLFSLDLNDNKTRSLFGILFPFAFETFFLSYFIFYYAKGNAPLFDFYILSFQHFNSTFSLRFSLTFY